MFENKKMSRYLFNCDNAYINLIYAVIFWP